MIQRCATCDRNVIPNDEGDCPSCGQSPGLSDDVIDLQSLAKESLATKVIECRKSKAFKRAQLIRGVLLTVVCGLIAYTGLHKGGTPFIIGGLVGVILFGCILVFELRNWNSNVVLLRIDDVGLHTPKSSSLWLDFKGIRRRHQSIYRFTDVSFRDQKGGVLPRILVLRDGMYDVPADDIFRAIQLRSEAFQASHQSPN